MGGKSCALVCVHESECVASAWVGRALYRRVLSTRSPGVQRGHCLGMCDVLPSCLAGYTTQPASNCANAWVSIYGYSYTDPLNYVACNINWCTNLQPIASEGFERPGCIGLRCYGAKHGKIFQGYRLAGADSMYCLVDFSLSHASGRVGKSQMRVSARRPCRKGLHFPGTMKANFFKFIDFCVRLAKHYLT